MWQHDATIETIVGDEFRERFSGSPENEMMQFDTRDAAAIEPSDAMRTAISPSIARSAKSPKFNVSPCLRISLSKRHPRIGPCIPNCRTVPGPVQPTL